MAHIALLNITTSDIRPSGLADVSVTFTLREGIDVEAFAAEYKTFRRHLAFSRTAVQYSSTFLISGALAEQLNGMTDMPGRYVARRDDALNVAKLREVLGVGYHVASYAAGMENDEDELRKVAEWAGLTLIGRHRAVVDFFANACTQGTEQSVKLSELKAAYLEWTILNNLRRLDAFDLEHAVQGHGWGMVAFSPKGRRHIVGMSLNEPAPTVETVRDPEARTVETIVTRNGVRTASTLKHVPAARPVAERRTATLGTEVVHYITHDGLPVKGPKHLPACSTATPRGRIVVTRPRVY
ncbi:hypothetical protein [Kocuria sp. CPCC 205263]|uniref:hypothetical protein n=1 Tax=Kocuria sp. CPCC 205263 TaxID=3073555 RepID=UPI0034D4A544